MNIHDKLFVQIDRHRNLWVCLKRYLKILKEIFIRYSILHKAFMLGKWKNKKDMVKENIFQLKDPFMKVAGYKIRCKAMESINAAIFPVRVHLKIMRLQMVKCFRWKETKNYFMTVNSKNLCIMDLANYQLKTTTLM